MNYAEFKRHMGKSGLANREFAELIGVHEKTISNMSKRDNVPNHMAALILLMGLLADKHIAFRDDLLFLELKKANPRGKSFNRKGHSDV